MQSNVKFAELNDLLSRLCDGEMDRPDWDRLETLLLDDPTSQDYYRRFVVLDVDLAWRAGGCSADLQFGPTAHETENEDRGAGDQRRGMAGSPAIDLPVGAAVEPPSGQWLRTPNPEPPFPTLSTTNYPPPATPFVGSWAFSCMVSAVIMGVMLLVFWAMKVTPHQHIAEAPSQSVPSDDRPEMVFVGRITGMVDVKWSDDPRYLPPPRFAHVPLGREYRLDAGLLEITYDSGAKVILQGPCTYKVESTAGGYLALGKLTALVEKRGGKGSRSKVQGPRPSLHPSSFILHPSSLFSIRTPTAIVTDLGTEFGVEVSDEGNTTSRVFRGSVKVQVVGDGRQDGVVLRENESARVEKGEGGPRLVMPGKVGDPLTFVRQLVRPPRVLDLLDIVAGGNGMGWGRERGIDPSTGMEDPVFAARDRGGDRQYRPVGWHKLIDGVFMPDGKAGPVQLDSAGHTFAGFPGTDGRVFGSIWARAAEVKPNDRRAEIINNWVYAMGPGKQFMPDHRGLLGLSPNVGITFNLEAMRRAHPGTVPSRFRAVAGLADARRVFAEHGQDPDRLPASVAADLWVFVDGRLKFKRLQLRPESGTLKVDVELAPGDRFLTLAVTDGGDKIVADWFVLGDPVLEMVSTLSENQE